MAGGGVSAFVEGVRELPRHWCGGRTGWKEAVTRPDPSPAPHGLVLPPPLAQVHFFTLMAVIHPWAC